MIEPEPPTTGAYRTAAKRALPTLPTLDNLGVAAPCDVPWEKMVGNGRARSCAKCSKQVFDISSMSRADAEALLRERVEGVCVRFYRRFDGTVLTADCPVGVETRRSARKVMLKAAAAVFGLLALIKLEKLVNEPVVPSQVNQGATMGFACATPQSRSDR